MPGLVNEVDVDARHGFMSLLFLWMLCPRAVATDDSHIPPPGAGRGLTFAGALAQCTSVINHLHTTVHETFLLSNINYNPCRLKKKSNNLFHKLGLIIHQEAISLL